MPLQQSEDQRIINVQWPGGKYLMLYVQGAAAVSGAQPSAGTDPTVNITVRSAFPWFNWTGDGKNMLSGVGLAEKTSTPPGIPTTDPVPLFNVSPNKFHAFPSVVETRERTSTATFHILDSGTYGLIDRITGATVDVGFNPFGEQRIPFTVSWDGSGGVDYTAPPNAGSLWSTNLALAIAIDCGLGGFNWDINLRSELTSHDETASYTSKNFTGTRMLFIAFDALKNAARAANQKVVTFDVEWSRPGAIGGKSTYEGYLWVARYLKVFGFKTWPLVDPSEYTVEDLINGDVDFFAGGPAFFPPNLGHPEVERFPDPADFTGAFEDFTTGETRRPSGYVRVTLTFKTDPEDPLDIDKIETANIVYAF